MTDLFPFEYVEKKSKVIIFGLGSWGRSYVEQIQQTNWCEIVGTSDSNSTKRIEGYIFFDVDKLSKADMDYVVISVKDTGTVNQIYRQLIRHGVPDSKIVSALCRNQQDYKIERVKQTECLHILFQVIGGLGDCVVCMSAYERIAGMLQMAQIDIQCRKTFGEALYADKRLIRKIIDEKEKIETDSYELVLQLAHGIKIVKFDKAQCSTLSPELYHKINELEKSVDHTLDNVIYQQYYYAIQIRRACVKGWNRYRALGHGDILNLSEDMVKVTLLEEYLPQYNALHLKKFITINYGADIKASRNKRQTKLWPYEYHVQLVSMLRMQYPEYEIVQLGSDGAEQITGVDRCIKGKDLELVKYILKNSTLHFDCEGGLVHLATALGTKCAVVFGPTPVEYYGYVQNINITAGMCHNCMHLFPEWYVRCLKGEGGRECMYGITPDMALAEINRYLENKNTNC